MVGSACFFGQFTEGSANGYGTRFSLDTTNRSYKITHEGHWLNGKMEGLGELRIAGETFVGEVPEYAVVVPGVLPARPLKNGQPGPSTACAVIVKRVDERTRAKTSINELLRD